MTATETAVSVAVAHCEDDRSAAAPLGRYADAPHHELPGRLGELVDRGLVGRAPGEQGCVREVLLCRGDTAAELLRLLERRPASVLALGWHGALAAGRALVLKQLLEEARCPLLVVRQAKRPGARLKIGEEIDAPG